MARFRVGECVRIIGKSSDHLGKTGIVGSVMSSRNSKLDRKSEELEALKPAPLARRQEGAICCGSGWKADVVRVLPRSPLWCRTKPCWISWTNFRFE
jgi:hypothetical protein